MCVEKKSLLQELNEILSELDAIEADEELEELAAELEDVIYLLECAEDDEEADGALEEIAGLAVELRELAAGEAPLSWLAEKLIQLTK